MIGSTILHYNILEKLGEGGMGIVYLAEDTKLGRNVALKFLPSHLNSTEDEKARFIQEARAASSLNHPNICTIYAIESENDQQFISMEYIEGTTLDKKISETPLKINDAIAYAIQIGEALKEAHGKGIVHRDVKPENIMINSKNQVKVMDFGLAKLKGSVKLTKASSTVGTLAYMAPEQIQGGEVDARSDIFSFGVILFEMLTGHLPFYGEHDASLMYSILNEEPKDINSIVSDLSPIVVNLIQRCLEKDPQDRYQTMLDAISELGRAKKKTGNVSRKTISYSAQSIKELPVREDVKETKPAKKKLWIMVGSLAALIILAGLSYSLFIKNSAPSLPPMKTVNFTSYQGIVNTPAFSPDGKSIAFVWNGVNQAYYNIYVKLIGAGSPFKLTNDPAYESSPVWSPDGRYIAFVKNNGLYIIPSLGGDERKITDVKRTSFVGGGIDWSPDGKNIVASASDSSGAQGIVLISVDTGEKQKLTSPENVNTYFTGEGSPRFSPNGSEIAFIKALSFSISELCVVPSAGGKVKQLTFDKHNIESEAWTPDGEEIIFSSNRSGNYALWRIPSDGGSAKIVAGTGEGAQYIDIAKEGNELAYIHSTNNLNIWHLDLSKSNSVLKSPTKLITSTQVQKEPQYSPDGKYIVFTSNRSGNYEIWRCNSDGSNPVQLTSFEGPSPGTPRWSPDGQSISFDCAATGNENIYVINSSGGRPHQITFNKSYDGISSWSRDGKWIYFASARSGNYQIWKIPSQGGNAIQVTKKGGLEGFESYDGKYLYFLWQPSEIFKVSVKGGEEEPVNDKILNDINFGGWALTDKGIYFAKIDSKGLGHISYYDFTTKKSKPIFVTPKPIYRYSGKIAVLPDGRSLLFVEVDQYSSNIILTQNFQ